MRAAREVRRRLLCAAQGARRSPFAAEQSLAESFEAADPTAWVDFYTEDAIMVTTVGVVEGRAALLALANQIRLSSFNIDAQTTDGDGDIAAILGRGS